MPAPTSPPRRSRCTAPVCRGCRDSPLGKGLEARALHPRRDVRDDALGIFETGVVGRDDHKIRKPLRHRAHQSAFAAVALPAAPEHRDKTRFCHRPRGFQQFFQPVRGVRVVYDDAAAVVAQHTESALHRPHFVHGVGERRPVHAQLVRGGHRGEQIIDVELPHQRRAHLGEVVGEIGDEAHPVHILSHVHGEGVGGTVKPVAHCGQPLIFRLCQELSAAGIVHVDHRFFHVFGREIGHLDRLILPEGAEVVQMIPSEIGEDGDIRPDARRLFQRDRVGGDLRHHGVHAASPHLEEKLGKLETVGSGQARPHFLSADIMPFRADDPHRKPGIGQDRRGIMRGGRLSVGAHHGDDLHPLRGVSPKRLGHQRVGPAHVADEDVGTSRRRLLFGDGDKVSIHFRQMFVAVVAPPFHAKKQVAVAHLSRMYPEGRDLEIFVRAHLDDARAVQQFFEPHRAPPA